MQMRPVETLGEISNILRLMEQPPRKVVAPKWITLAAALSGQQAEGSTVLVVLSWSCPLGCACLAWCQSHGALVAPHFSSTPTCFLLAQEAFCPLIGHIFQLALLFCKLWAIKN